MWVPTSIRRLFNRRRAHGSLFDSGAAVSDPDDSRNAADGEHSESASQGGPNGATAISIEAKPVRVSHKDRAETIQEISTLVRKVGDHFDRHAVRSERLIEIMDRIPDSLAALPELSRQHQRLLNVVNEHLESTRGQNDALNATLKCISETASDQQAILSDLREQIEHDGQRSALLIDHIGDLHRSFQQMAESNRHTADALTGLRHSAEEHDRRVADLLQRTQRWMIAASCFAGGVCLIAVVVALFALFGQTAS